MALLRVQDPPAGRVQEPALFGGQILVHRVKDFKSAFSWLTFVVKPAYEREARREAHSHSLQKERALRGAKREKRGGGGARARRTLQEVSGGERHAHASRPRKAKRAQERRR